MRAGAVIIVCVGLVACSRREQHKEPEPVPVGETSITAAVFERQSSTLTFLETDPGLTRSVERAIARDPHLAVAAKNVDVSIEHGVVALQGSVPDWATRDALEQTVKRIPGVNFVQDDVVASPVRDLDGSESDERIAFSLQRALHSEPSVRHDAETVTIDVKGGLVTLRGSVNDASTSAAVERIVMDTPGAVSVSNELRVRGD